MGDLKGIEVFDEEFGKLKMLLNIWQMEGFILNRKKFVGLCLCWRLKLQKIIDETV